MDSAWLALLAGVIGAVAGVTATVLIRQRSVTGGRGAGAAAELRVDDDVASVLSTLRSASVLLGPDDQVLRSTPPAYSMGLVRAGAVSDAGVLSLVSTVRREGTVADAQLSLRRGRLPGSDPQTLDIRVAPLPGGRILILADDRTAEHRVEQVRRDFVANVSHELKTPVGAIQLLAETAADAADDAEAVRRFTGRMQRESVRLAALVQEIIELSRLQAPEKTVDFTVIEVDDVVSEAVDRARLEAEAREMTVIAGGEAGLRVLGDHGLLVTAVRNLLDNALRYSPQGSHVTVGVRVVDGVVEIAVVDQGIGISAENTRRVFERFYRVDPARSRETGGTGLGLSIVKHVAANHGGEVTVWSAKSRGSTFTLRIPEADGQDGAPDQAALTDSPAGRDGAPAAQDTRPNTEGGTS